MIVCSRHVTLLVCIQTQYLNRMTANGCICQHAAILVQEAPIYTFVAIVPVTMDALFKYWIFKGLNSKNPAAAVTLKNMDRH